MKKQDVLNMLRAVFFKNRVLDMGQLQKSISVTARMTVFRYLKELRYLTSYTHTGQYYTLPEIAQFDEDGFWHHGDIGFSLHGTLMNTLQWIISSSESGKTNSELEKLFKIRIQNSLQKLLKPSKIASVKSQKQVVYTSSDSSISQKQLKNRQAIGNRKKLPPWIVAEVLIEALHSLSGSPQIEDVMKRLKKRGSLITHEQVLQVFEESNLEKKTPD